MCKCSKKIKKAVKMLCFLLVVIVAIDSGINALGCKFLDYILTPCAISGFKVAGGISGILLLICVMFCKKCNSGCNGACGKECECGCKCGCECGCNCEDGCQCKDDCKCNHENENNEKKCCHTE